MGPFACPSPTASLSWQRKGAQLRTLSGWRRVLLGSRSLRSTRKRRDDLRASNSEDGGPGCPVPSHQPATSDWSRSPRPSTHVRSRQTGQMYCWGLNNAGQLGSTSASPCVASDYYYGYGTWAVAWALLPQVVPNAPAFSNVAAGYTTCAVATAGPVGASDRPVGTNFRPRARSRPFRPTAPARSAPVATDSCWFANFDVPSASLTPTGQSVFRDCLHRPHRRARASFGILKSNGAAVCWGNNGVGQLGIGATGESKVPIAVVGPP